MARMMLFSRVPALQSARRRQQWRFDWLLPGASTDFTLKWTSRSRHHRIRLVLPVRSAGPKLPFHAVRNLARQLRCRLGVLVGCWRGLPSFQFLGHAAAPAVPAGVDVIVEMHVERHMRPDR